MHRHASLFLLSIIAGLVAAGCAGDEPPDAATGGELATQGAAVVSGTSVVTLCNLPRYTAETTVQLCGFTTPGSDESAIAAAWFSVDGGDAIAVEPANGGFVAISTSLAEGTHAIRLYARSTAGNLTFEEGVVTVDATPPVLEVLAPTSADVMTSTVVNVTSSVSDITPVFVQTQWYQSSTVDSGTGTVTHTADLVNRGYNTLLVRATDATGNVSEARVTVYFCPDDDEACFASALWAPVIISTYQSTNTVPASGGVTFRVVASDPQSSPLSYSWTASVGTLGVPVSDSTTSEVVWTPPACVTADSPPSITATVTNAVGGSDSASFSLSGGEACPVCGDGVTKGSEVCDDGNTVTETSCPYGQRNCTACNATCSTVLSLTGAYCGDGLRSGPEVCDDGNTVTETSCPYGQASCTACNATCTTVLHLEGEVPADCNSGSVSWSQAQPAWNGNTSTAGTYRCRGTVPAASHGDRVSATLTSSTRTGSAQFTCVDGSWVIRSGSSCDGETLETEDAGGIHTTCSSSDPVRSLWISWYLADLKRCPDTAGLDFWVRDYNRDADCVASNNYNGHGSKNACWRANFRIAAESQGEAYEYVRSLGHIAPVTEGLLCGSLAYPWTSVSSFGTTCKYRP